MTADLVLYNGIIHTQDELSSVVSAIAIRAGRVLATGRDDDMLALRTQTGEAINLAGRTVIPGLTDAHVHFCRYAAFLHNLDLSHTSSAQDAAQLVSERAQEAEPGEWIIGRGWLIDRWDPPVRPDRGILDSLVPSHPVYLLEHSAHAAWINSEAMRRAGLNKEMPDPPGGTVVRDNSGEPTGLLEEAAIHLLRDVLPTDTPEQMATKLRKAIEHAHRCGLTGVHDFDSSPELQAFQIAQQRGDLTIRVLANLRADCLDDAIGLGLRSGTGNDFLRIGAVKSFADGVLGLHTAWMLEPYSDQPDIIGIAVDSPEKLLHDVRRASEAGLSSAIHAIGDRAIREVLDVFEIVRQEEVKRGIASHQMRHRIEHVQVIHPDDSQRLAALQVIASMQPNHLLSDMEKADTYWGDRADYAYHWRLQQEAGAILALGSDAPVEPIDPLPNIQCAVTACRPDGSPHPQGWRPHRDRRLGVGEAIKGFTYGPAYAAYMEDRLGKLAPGYYADLVVLDRDIYNCEPLAISVTEVLGTLVGGRWVYRQID